MKNLFPVCFLLCCLPVKAQRFIWSPDSIVKGNPNYVMDRYHEILGYHDPIMYLAYPVVRPVAGRAMPLLDGEGKDGYWLEGNFAYRFSIYQGKYYSYRFFQRIRPTLDLDLLLRLSKDHSSPLLPSNNKVGLGLDYLWSGMEGLSREKAVLIWSTFQLHHYSNGQADSFFVDAPIRRNNYKNGDFSTNYYRVLLNLGGTSREKSIVSGGIGFQREIDLGGPLSSSPELERYYGNDRLLAHFQWVQKPRLATIHYQNRSTTAADTIEVEKRRQVSFRTLVDYILRGVSRYQGENKRRLGWHSYLTYMPSVSNEVGFMLHTYLGRDYLNIRFDDPVFIGELGIYVRFNGR